MKKIFKTLFATILAAIMLTPASCGRYNNIAKKIINKTVDNFDDKPLSEKWVQKDFITDHYAADSAINLLITSADAGDKKKFMLAFSENIRNSEGFEKKVDEFLKVYPKGIGENDIEGGLSESSASYNYGHTTQVCQAHYTCTIGKEWYSISLKLCFENTDFPDNVGVTGFIIRNLEAYAKDQQENTDLSDTLLECRIISSEEVSARLINNKAFIFKPYPDRTINEDDMKILLKGHPDFSLIVNTLGEPNVSIKYDNHTGYDYYYELEPENGEPRYAHIVTSSPSGKCIDAFLLSDTDDFGYKRVLLEYQRPEVT